MSSAVALPSAIARLTTAHRRYGTVTDCAAVSGPVRPTATRGGVIDLSGLRGAWSSLGYRYEHHGEARLGTWATHGASLGIALRLGH